MSKTDNNVSTALTDEENQFELQKKEYLNDSKAEPDVEIIQHELIDVSNLRKDIGKIIFLVYLYFLQGIPIGLGVSVPYILSSRAVSYSEQGTFSFSGWPFSLKLLWAPIVDSIYIYKFGRRKSWLVSVQFLIGIVMLSFASVTQTLIVTSQSNAGNFIRLSFTSYLPG